MWDWQDSDLNPKKMNHNNKVHLKRINPNQKLDLYLIEMLQVF